MEKITKAQLSGLGVILLFLALVSAGDSYDHAKMARIQACNAEQAELVQTSFGTLPSTILAKAFYVYDFTKKSSLYAKNENTALPLASLTKLMTIRVALKQVTPATFYTIKAHDLDADGPIGFVVGDTYTVEDLIHAALVESSNNAAYMISQSVGVPTDAFVAAMNVEAENIGLPTLHYSSVTGLDTAALAPTAVGSAHDILMLLDKDENDFPDQLAVSTHEQDTISATNGRSIPMNNTDLAIPSLQVLMASKTGYTISAGGNLAVLWHEQGGDLLGASVLGSTETGRFSDMVTIHDAADAYVTAAKNLPGDCGSI